MLKLNFKLSDDQKFQAIWSLLNTEYNEENDWAITYGISAVYEDYALVVNYESGEMYRAYYTKNDENDMVELGELVKCYIIDVTEKEKNTLDTLRALNGDTYELVSDVLVNAQSNFEKISDFSSKIEELNSSIATLETEKNNANTKVDEYNNQLEVANGTINSLNEEIKTLKEYKLNIETQQKHAVINQYSELLSEEILDSYKNQISDFTTEELDMRLAYELKKSNSSIFTKGED